MEQIYELIILYVVPLLGLATECGLFFIIKSLLTKQVNKIQVSENMTTLNKQLEVLISDNAQLRAQNKKLIDKLLQVKNGSDKID